MISKIPDYPNPCLDFEKMFYMLIAYYTSNIGISLTTVRELTTSQSFMIIVVSKTIQMVGKLVSEKHVDALGLEILEGQVCCQRVLEISSNYNFDNATVNEVVVHEAYLRFLKIGIKLVDIVMEWIDKQDDKLAKQKLAGLSSEMASCSALLKFANVPSNYVTKGTLLKIMPLKRFQTTETIFSSEHARDRERAELDYEASPSDLKEAKKLYDFYMGCFLVPLAHMLDNAYYVDIAKCN